MSGPERIRQEAMYEASLALGTAKMAASRVWVQAGNI
jgi:hypothetical protein